MTQEELLEQIYKKDGKAFSSLYDMYSKSLYGVIFNLLKNKEEAEDVLQEVFVKIWKNIDSYNDTKGRFFTWILNISRNAAIDRLRSKDHTKNLKNLSVDNFVHILDHNATVVNKIDAIGIREFITKLKPTCVRIIELLFFKGYTQQEASDELAMPLGTVKTQNRNCIKDLRTILEV